MKLQLPYIAIYIYKGSGLHWGNNVPDDFDTGIMNINIATGELQANCKRTRQAQICVAILLHAYVLECDIVFASKSY